MIEQQILQNLLFNEQYLRRVLPFIKREYFGDRVSQKTFDLIEQFVEQYNKPPSVTALLVGADDITDLNDTEVGQLKQTLNEFHQDDRTDLEWLVNTTEKFCQDKAVYNAIMTSIGILDGKKSISKGAIPQLLSDALAVSFDTHIGHDFVEDALLRYDLYHKTEEKIPFDLSWFNKITNGGLNKKTLNIALAGTGVGKSLFMCHVAAGAMTQGKNVLYITLEMAEEKIAERIDANLLDTPLDMIAKLPRDVYEKKIGKFKSNTVGKLIIKEYPTATAGVNHFRHLLQELKMKKNFVPDIIFIDYLNICISSRIKAGGNVNSYSYVKAIAEELRGLAVEQNVPIVSATQTTRSGYSSTDVGLEDTSESFGLPATADLMFALIAPEELQQLGQIMIKQLKSRYQDPGQYRRFVVGVDKSRMKLYDVEQSAQQDIVEDDEPQKPARPDKKKFTSFK